MLFSRRGILRFTANATALIALSARAEAQAYPTRPVTMIVPFPAGGAADAMGRLVAERMQDRLGQSVIVENVTGAAGSIGPGRVARSANDGYTIGLGTFGTHVVNRATMALSYDVVKDFEPIALLSTQPMMIVSRQDFPAKNLKDLIACLKTIPTRPRRRPPDRAARSTSQGSCSNN